MPEFPEVETIVLDLNKKILGRKIEDIWFDWYKVKFLNEIKNRKIEKVIRKGKNILIYLSGGKLILIHQKLTGHLLYGKWKISKAKSEKREVQSLLKGPLEEKVNNYIHLIFYLNNGWQLALSDLRKFAKVLAGDAKIIENLPELKNLGPDPLKIFSNTFEKTLRQAQGKIKQVLMNQEVLAGIGNIYSDEILWLAGVHPLKKIEKLKPQDFKKIYNATKNILSKALKLRGASISDYRDTSGKAGKYDLIRKAYQREGEKCKRSKCGGIIKRLKIGGRSAHFCSKHQILK